FFNYALILRQDYDITSSLRRGALQLLTADSRGPKSSEDEVVDDAGKKSTKVLRKKNEVQDPAKEGDKSDQEKDLRYQEKAIRKQFEQESERFFDPGRERAQRNKFESMVGQDKDANGNMMFTHVSAAGSSYVNLDGSIHVNVATLPNADLPTNHLMSDLEDTIDLQDIRIFSGAYDDEVEGVKADFNNLEPTKVVSPIPITKIYKDHPKEQIIKDPLSAPQTRRMIKTSQEHVMVSYIQKQKRTNHKDYHNFLLACFLSQIEPKKVIQALIDPSWMEAMQDELLQNKNDERGILVRNNARLVAQGYTQEEEINYDEVFAPVARIEAIKLFLDYASFMGFIMYQMDVKSAFLYGIIEEKVIDAQEVLDEFYGGAHFLLRVAVKTTSTPIETNKALLKDEEAEDVNVYLYRSMIGSLMYLTASRPDIMDSPFDLEAFLDSDYAGASIDKKSTTGGCQFLGKRLISWQCKKQIVVANSTIEVEYVTAANCCRQVQQSSMVGFGEMIQLKLKKQKSRRKQRKEIEVPTPSSKIPNEESVPIPSNDPLPSAKEIASLKKRVKKLEEKRKLRTLGLNRLRKGRMIDNIDQDVEITLVDTTQGRMNEEDMFRVNDLDGDEVVVDVSASVDEDQSVKVVEKEVSTADLVTTAGEVVTTAGIEVTNAARSPQISKDELTTVGIKVTTAATSLQISKDELTLAQTLIEIKAAKPKAIITVATTVTAASTRPKEKGIAMQEPSKTSLPKPIDSSQKPSQVKDKGKEKMVEPEKPLKRKDQSMIDDEFAKNLEAQMQAELEEEERLARIKEEETNIALIESWAFRLPYPVSLNNINHRSLSSNNFRGKALALGDEIRLMCLLGGEWGLVTKVLAGLGLVT
nr:hypothetical protein [Tanacetum cinerariifolium]